MKVIGRGKGTILLSATPQEVARLVGFYYDDANSRVGHMDVGDEIDVHGMFMQLYTFKSNQNTLRSVAEKLETYAQLLRLEQPIIEAATDGEQIKE